MNEMISIARDGEELGTWSEVEVARMLRCGALSSTDYFWHPSMAEWSTLDCFHQAQPGKKTYSVAFATERSTENFGFTRAGKVTLAHDTIEFAGMRPWPAWMRLLLFAIMTPAFWFTFFMLSDVLPGKRRPLPRRESSLDAVLFWVHRLRSCSSSIDVACA